MGPSFRRKRLWRSNNFEYYPGKRKIIINNLEEETFQVLLVDEFTKIYRKYTRDTMSILQ